MWQPISELKGAHVISLCLYTHTTFIKNSLYIFYLTETTSLKIKVGIILEQRITTLSITSIWSCSKIQICISDNVRVTILECCVGSGGCLYHSYFPEGKPIRQWVVGWNGIKTNHFIHSIIYIYSEIYFLI